MTAKILDGKSLAKSLRGQLANDLTAWKERGHRLPKLAVILVGDNPASTVYVAGKRRDCQEIGLPAQALHLSDSISQAELEEHVEKFNADVGVDGILVQTPLPNHIDADRIIDRIDPSKDVDGFHAYNLGRLALRRPTLRSCTPKGVMQLLEQTGRGVRGLNATILGASNHVGRPMGLELLLAGATVTTAHKFTRDTGEMVRDADIVVSAVGRPDLVQAEWIKPGAIVIDIGITRGQDNKLRGDVDFAATQEIAAWITPVPGGVGPMTRIALLQNTVQAAADRMGLPWPDSLPKPPVNK